MKIIFIVIIAYAIGFIFDNIVLAIPIAATFLLIPKLFMILEDPNLREIFFKKTIFFCVTIMILGFATFQIFHSVPVLVATFFTIAVRLILDIINLNSVNENLQKYLTFIVDYPLSVGALVVSTATVMPPVAFFGFFLIIGQIIYGYIKLNLNGVPACDLDTLFLPEPPTTEEVIKDFFMTLLKYSPIMLVAILRIYLGYITNG